LPLLAHRNFSFNESRAKAFGLVLPTPPEQPRHSRHSQPTFLPTMPSKFGYRLLRDSSACGYAENKKYQANHQEKEEQQFGDTRSRNSNTGESKKRRHQRNYQKD